MRIDRVAAAGAFDEALELAAGNRRIPQTWMSRFRRLTNERTYSAVLATALLARSVEPRADAFVLQAKEGGDGYSARGLFTQVIFERANLRGIPLGSIGREPHNNQPFYGHSRIQDIDRRRLRRFSVPRFDDLLASLEAANALSPHQALEAFAAFLRIRLQEPILTPISLSQPPLDLLAMRGGIRRLIARGGEAGRRGEAVVAAALDLIFPNVHLNAKANDPSRHWPGDVVALLQGRTIKTRKADDLVVAVEVKERIATEGEILQFVSNVGKLGVHRGLYVALGSAQSTLDLQRLQDEAWRRHSVALQIVIGIDALLNWTLALSPLPLVDAISKLAIRVSERLREKEATSGFADWSSFLQQLGPAAGAVVPLLRPSPRRSS